MKIIPLLMSGLLALTALHAQAQWQWVDKDGRKVFSDRPPPSDVPDKNIQRRPATAQRTFDAAPAATAQALVPSVPTAAASRPTGADKELQERKRQAQEAETAKRKADEERLARQQADNCARARQSKAGMDTGQRMSRFNDKGEREILDDAARAEEARRLQAIIDADCK